MLRASRAAGMYAGGVDREMGTTRAERVPGQLTWANSAAVNLSVFFSPPSTKSFAIAFCRGSRAFDPELEEEKKVWVFFVLTVHSDYESRLMRFDYHGTAL